MDRIVTPEMEQTASVVLAVPGTITDTDRKNAAVRLAELVLGITDEKGQ